MHVPRLKVFVCSMVVFFSIFTLMLPGFSSAEEIDLPPVITQEPMTFPDVQTLSTDPGAPTVVTARNLIYWLYADDEASCTGMTAEWQYRAAGSADPTTVLTATLFQQGSGAFTQNVDILGSGTYEVQVVMTDCAGNVLTTPLYYITVDMPPEITSMLFSFDTGETLSTDSSDPTPMIYWDFVQWSPEDDEVCGDMTIGYEYREIGSGDEMNLNIIGNGENTGLYNGEWAITTHLYMIDSFTDYEIRAIVTDCAGQSVTSPSYYFRVDQPPEITKEPTTFLGQVTPSTDSGMPTVITADNFLYWWFNDDEAICSGTPTSQWQYRTAGSADPMTVQDANLYNKTGYTDTLDTLGTGTYEFQVVITDCAGRTTTSDSYYFTVPAEYAPTEYAVVCDPDTSLCWQDPQREAHNYDDQGVRAFEADQYCDELVLGGFDDWRVPTIMELRSITAGFAGTESDGACPIVDGDITYDDAQNINCFHLADGALGNGPGDNGCYLKSGFTGTCDKPDPYSGGHPLEHVALETPSDTDAWRAVLMFENGSVLFNHACTGVDVRCVRDDDGSPIVDCVENEACTPGETKDCECSGFGDRPDGIQTCNDAGDCWGPCECTKSIIDTSVDPECNRGNEFYDQADILTVNISLPVGDTIDYDPAVLTAFLYECADENTPMPSRPPDGGSWENQVADPGPPPYSIPIRGITYYRERLIEGRHCILIQMSQRNVMPPIPASGDYYYWNPSQGLVFPLDGGAETVDVTLIKFPF